MTLRPYQVTGAEFCFDRWSEGARRVAVVLPTGTGKTHIIAELVRRWIAEGRQPSRVLVLAHRDELIKAARKKIAPWLPGHNIGIIKGTQNGALAPIVIGSVQTLRSARRRAHLVDVGLIIIDECHHAAAQSYIDILAHFGAIDPPGAPPRERRPTDALAAGFTATLMRSDGAQLADIWPEVTRPLSFQEAVALGYLVPPRTFHIYVADLDLSRVKKNRGDYADGDLGRAVGASLAPDAIIRAYRKHCDGLPALGFAPTVALAEEMAQHFVDNGYRSACVSGKTTLGVEDVPDPETRCGRIELFRRGELDILWNCGVFTEGTDLPRIRAILLMRPTKSQGLFIQMVGRGARPDPDNPEKDEFILLDLVGASQDMTLSASVDMLGEPVKLKTPKDGADEVEEGEDEPEPRPEPAPVDRRSGKLTSEEVDIFGRSRLAWSTTELGTWFLRLRDGYVALAPGVAPGTYDVVRMGEGFGNSRYVAMGFTSLADAMRQAEVALSLRDRMPVKRDARWRAGSSAGLAARARQLGIPVANGMPAGLLFDLIAMREASERIDPCTKRIIAMRASLAERTT